MRAAAVALMLCCAPAAWAGTHVKMQISVDGVAVAQGFHVSRTARVAQMWFGGPMEQTPLFAHAAGLDTDKEIPDKVTLSGKIEMTASGANFSPKAEPVIKGGSVKVDKLTLVRQKDGKWKVSPEDVARTLRMLREGKK